MGVHVTVKRTGTTKESWLWDSFCDGRGVELFGCASGGCRLRPMARSRFNDPIDPMTLGNMRASGVHARR